MTGLSSLAGKSGQQSDMTRAIPLALLPARARFHDLILQRIMAFESFRIDFHKRRDPKVALEGVISLAHMIAGVAETLGYPVTGKMAAALEQQSREGLDRKIPAIDLWHSTEPLLIALMDELEAILDQQPD